MTRMTLARGDVDIAKRESRRCSRAVSVLALGGANESESPEEAAKVLRLHLRPGS